MTGTLPAEPTSAIVPLSEDRPIPADLLLFGITEFFDGGAVAAQAIGGRRLE